MQRPLLVFLFFFIFCFSANSQSVYSIKGVVLDAESKEQLTGATISVEIVKRNTRAGLDGSYSLANLAAGTYKLHCSFLGYRTKDTTIVLKNNDRLNFFLRNTSAVLHGVEIAGKTSKETDAAVRKQEQNADNVVNLISAKAIQLSPDITIANVLQRVSGVSLERSSSGDGRYAIIRGMDQRYNYTLVNGIKIPSPDNKNRYVPLDIFPADLVEYVEVNKTLTPNMEADAVGGTVNMVMKNAPNRLYLNTSLSTGYSQNLFNKGYNYFPVSAINRASPLEANGPSYLAKPEDFTRDNLNYTKKSFRPNTIASLSVGNRFLNNKLGIMLGASYQNTYKSYTSLFNPAEYLDQSNANGVLITKHAYIRDFSSQLTRIGFNGKIDYVINEQNKLSLYTFYAILNDAQTRLTTDSLQTGKQGPGLGQVWYFGRSRYQHQEINNYTLQGQHTLLKGLKLDWTGAYSKASSNVPDLAEYEYDAGNYAEGTGADPFQHPNKVVDYDRIWERNSDRDWSGYGNLSYANQFKSIPFTFSAGGMYRSKHRDNFYNDYDLRTVPNADGSFQLWTDIYHFNWSVFNPGGSPANSNTYRADEDISAGYAMLKFRIKKLETIVGLRVENTDQRFATDIPETSPGKTGTISYTDKLPSVHFKYMLNDKSNLRLSYFSSINRPGYFEIIPTNVKGDEYTETGNPNLKHATADNLDARYEFFPKSNEQILVGAFYKKITNPIEYGFVGQKADQFQPGNFGDATNYGFEVVYEKYISKFGLRLNYTYTKSEITTDKRQTFNNLLMDPLPTQTRPLQGQSAHVANVALLYKDIPAGIDVQLAWQYTGKRIALVSPYYDFDQWQKGLSMFDISAEKKFRKKFAVFAKVQNLLNTADEYYINKPLANDYPAPFQKAGSNQTLSKRNLYGQNYQLGLRYIY
ncbi:TonB-dependent receptor [Pedobacter sp. HMWF019]|uniref:TonB-dependent receptor n=1 Tax=Pedobacter sp. HMWF019 TaxID=2056856 RepID=UPI000D3A3B30|nr:TonB-dependent receptor [Pedobacter sp. HMWF019]PTS99521.1 TonB-dependent receptor [Pedobacter sp. HMWF019]